MAGALVVGLHHLDPSAEADGVVVFQPLELPWIAAGEPVLWSFLLPAVANDLAEKAVVVADAVAVRGDLKGRHAVHEAGGEAAEAAVAERRVRLDPPEFAQVDAEFMQRFGHRLGDAEIGHRVEKQPADQEFEREVIDAFAPIGVDVRGRAQPAVDDEVAGREGDGEEPVARAGDLRNFADRIGQLGQNGGL